MTYTLVLREEISILFVCYSKKWKKHEEDKQNTDGQSQNHHHS